MKSRLNRMNELLRKELGSNVYGGGLYRWEWSEDLRHPARVPDKFDYKAHPSGLVVVEPVYELRKTCPWLDHQWVVTMWTPPILEQMWRSLFGYGLEWPRTGEYVPTNVDLDRGVDPWDLIRGKTMTEWVVDAIRDQRKKRFSDHMREAEEVEDRREKENERILEDQILDLRLPFAHIPGKKDHVSLPTPRSEGEL